MTTASTTFGGLRDAASSLNPLIIDAAWLDFFVGVGENLRSAGLLAGALASGAFLLSIDESEDGNRANQHSNKDFFEVKHLVASSMVVFSA